VFVIALLFLLFPFQCCEDNVWKGITPFKSTRADVEKLVGPSTIISVRTGNYKTKDESVFVVYSQKPCSIRLTPGNTPDSLVVIMEVSPVIPPKLSDLKIDQSKFEKTIDEARNQTNYSNLKDGITVTVDSREQNVTKITYTPEKAFADQFCKNNK
jgi:hypothetical protein